jgi:hypothetical protein
MHKLNRQTDVGVRRGRPLQAFALSKKNERSVMEPEIVVDSYLISEASRLGPPLTKKVPWLSNPERGILQ